MVSGSLEPYRFVLTVVTVLLADVVNLRPELGVVVMTRKHHVGCVNHRRTPTIHHCDRERTGQSAVSVMTIEAGRPK